MRVPARPLLNLAPVVGDPRAGDGVVVGNAGPFAVGDVVGGHYRIRGLLGRGGMSYVHEADDLTLRRRVAIKVDDRRDPRPLLQEAQALAAVRHPGLPAVYELGAFRGWPFLVLERLYGVTAAQRLDAPGPDTRLDVAEVVRILAGVAEVLIAVHTAGMTHRDVKPSNVMLCAHERVVLLDFGIMVPEVAAGWTDVCGTPGYVAPEVGTGEVRPGRAHLVDLYALGVTGIELLTGWTPLGATTQVDPLTLAPANVPPPDLRSARPDVPEALAALIDACRAWAPADRPASIEQVAWELRAIQRRLPRFASGSSIGFRASR